MPPQGIDEKQYFLYQTIQGAEALAAYNQLVGTVADVPAGAANADRLEIWATRFSAPGPDHEIMVWFRGEQELDRSRTGGY